MEPPPPARDPFHGTGTGTTARCQCQSALKHAFGSSPGASLRSGASYPSSGSPRSKSRRPLRQGAPWTPDPARAPRRPAVPAPAAANPPRARSSSSIYHPSPWRPQSQRDSQHLWRVYTARSLSGPRFE
eukprot:1990507-Prymnesium_polylepis.1